MPSLKWKCAFIFAPTTFKLAIYMLQAKPGMVDLPAGEVVANVAAITIPENWDRVEMGTLPDMFARDSIRCFNNHQWKLPSR